MFTGVIKLANIDDYIAPSQECVKPLMEKAQGPLKAAQGSDKEGPAKATITLNDCLACSGCVTSAETILIEQMSITEFLSKAKQRKTIVFMSPQSRASLARHYKVSQTELLVSLSAFLKTNFNVMMVLDMQEAIDICHSQIVQEFRTTPQEKYPILCSECPGWVCYAEKVAPPEAIPHMSKVKSPQQIMGALIREKFQEVEYVVGIMPCYDKKLEAIRFDFKEGQKQVELVLTSQEIVDLINKVQKGCNCKGINCNCECKKEEKQDIVHFPYKTTSEIFDLSQFSLRKTKFKELPRVKDPKCNGYIHILLEHLNVKDYKTKQIRNSDFIEYEFELAKQKIKMAQCYGFRNIQNVVRFIKTKKCEYAYIEIMACPSGCFNGGGQIKDSTIKPKQLATALQAEIIKECKQTQSDISFEKNERFITEYKSLQKNISSVLTNW